MPPKTRFSFGICEHGNKPKQLTGLASKNRLKEILPVGSSQVLKTEIDKSGEDAKGKFGRILGDFLIEEKRATEILIEEGHAVPYHGQSKDDVHLQHMANRERLLNEGKVSLEGVK